MSFQFGTYWPGFMERVGNIAGPLLGYEVLTAFFLEATFLGVMLFGHGKVSERAHLSATFLVAFGTTMSAFWIIALNSWMHTPAGHYIRNTGEFFVSSWLEVIFNPSFPYRLTHVLLASGLTASLILAAVLTPLQIIVGDLQVVPQEPEPTAQEAAPAECEANCAHHRPVRLSWASLAGRAGPEARRALQGA